MGTTVFFENAKGLEIFPHNKEFPQPLPTNVKLADEAFLEANPQILSSLVDCYRQVFGGADVWGEGWKCPSCGHFIPIENGQDGQVCDSCRQSKFVPYYEPEELKTRILDDLDKKSGCALLMDLNDPNKVIGFVWGMLFTLEEVAEKIISERFYDDKVFATKFKVDFLAAAMEKQGLKPSDIIIYTSEMALLRDHRTGNQNVTAMITAVFSYLHDLADGKARSQIFWSGEESSLVDIAVLAGYEKIYTIMPRNDEEPELYVISGPDAYKHALAIFQNFSLAKVHDIYQEAAKSMKA